jgi:hypothetical protein
MTDRQTDISTIRDSQGADLNLERRREVRYPRAGEVRLWANDPIQEVRANLLDMSASGFRAAHGYSGLSVGTEVWFRHAAAEGRARVVWNRILPSGVETGFLLA